jgi:hypothetical protein
MNAPSLNLLVEKKLSVGKLVCRCSKSFARNVKAIDCLRQLMFFTSKHLVWKMKIVLLAQSK